MSVDPGWAERARKRRDRIITGLPRADWSDALISTLGELDDAVAELARRTPTRPAPAPAPAPAEPVTAEVYIRRPDEAYAVALRILAQLDTVPTVDQIARVRAGLYGGGRGTNGQSAD